MVTSCNTLLPELDDVVLKEITGNIVIRHVGQGPVIAARQRDGVTRKGFLLRGDLLDLYLWIFRCHILRGNLHLGNRISSFFFGG